MNNGTFPVTFRTWWRLFLCALLLSVNSGARATQSFTVAVVPQFPAEQIFRDWTPVLNEASQLSGLAFTLKTYASIPEFESDFLNGRPDFAFMNPYHAVMAQKAMGYMPILRDDAGRLTGILVVRKDSPITRVDQLKGATLAFPAPNAFGASLYMRALLTREQNIHFKPEYVTTHSNVFRNVIVGRAQAGGAIRQTLEQESPALQAQLRILYETPAAYSHPISAHPRVPAQVREALLQAFLKMGANPAFADQLKAIQIAKPVKADFMDYAPLETLGLERFVVIRPQ
ncbi:MAG: phosphate/phosphite/phosphonate ABC transporter substrate-binding protein [Rhodoferax sp.]|nr:phosphate/phosphite/phosphonate ABC transporter substrate-binding protein [Rhodoferax sp.]